jgi:hypothetical protein
VGIAFSGFCNPPSQLRRATPFEKGAFWAAPTDALKTGLYTRESMEKSGIFSQCCNQKLGKVLFIQNATRILL